MSAIAIFHDLRAKARIASWIVICLLALARTANSGLPGAIAIFPVVRHAGVAKNEPDQIGEAPRADIVRQDGNTRLNK
jgi:hypothetical protein